MRLLPIMSCIKCPYHHTTPYPVADPWERADFWWCTHPKNEKGIIAPDEEAERARLNLIHTGAIENLIYVAAYVEENVKIKIPETCKLKKG